MMRAHRSFTETTVDAAARAVSIASLLAILTLSPLAANAQDAASSTLKKINDTGVINLGIREASVPFSYYDDKQRTVGYSIDIAQRIIAAIKQRLNKPELTVKMIPVTAQNRIPLMQNGTIDLECGSTTNTFARQNQAAFSNSIFLYGIRMITKKTSGIKDFPDLAGKVVETTAGTSDERMLKEMNEQKKMNMTIVSAQDHPQAFAAVVSGRAVAFVMDEPLLYGERAKVAHPDDYVVVGNPPVRENYACMLRKGDPEFKKLVDDTVAQFETSGEAAKLYTTWFMSPIPPNGMNLHYPLSDDMKALFAKPNDQALD